MSFILDALKKSEMERQRQATPGMVESGTARHRPRLPVWAIALGALLAVNLVVLVVVLTRSASESPPPHVAAQNQLPNAPAAEAVAAPGAASGTGRPPAQFSPLDAPAEYAPEIPVAGPSAAAPLPPARWKPAPDAVRTGRHRGPAAGGPAAGEPVLAKDDYRADEESLPTINEITQTLPDLHLDVHVYATQPAERFVFINMRKYHEGGTLQEGPTVDHIRRDGVVLSYQGLKFLLPRQ